MRKLLQTTATVTFSVAIGSGTVWSQVTSADLLPNIMQGVPTLALPIQAANNANNVAPMALPNGVANPTPGSIVVHINGRVLFAPVAEWSSLDVFRASPATAPTKLSNLSNVGFMRIYPGVDAMATNGLRYGGSIELRQNFGPTAGSTASSNGSANSFSSAVFVRRAFVYLANDRIGILRMGQGDGVLGLFDSGVTTFQNFDTGGWDGDLQGSVPGNANLSFPFPALQGAEYVSSKIVYLSPRLGGFDVGFAYAPNSGALQDGPTVNSLTSTVSTLTTCAVAASGCASLSTSNIAIDGARFRNLIEAGVRYQGNFGPVGLYGFGIYNTSGHVNVSQPVTGGQFNGLNFGDFGLAATYGGLTIGGHAMVGQFNGVMALQPKGGVSANAWLFGKNPTTGPLTAGASYYVYQSQGSPITVGIAQRVERGLAVGGNYTLAPGLSLYGSYLYGTRHQGNFNFATGTAGTASNDVKTQLIAFGTLVKW
jgi:predicted porin